MKNPKGITLIALIITIIVLAILAAVSITSLTGQNGIVKEALKTSEEKDIADEEEQVKLAYSSTAMKNYGYGTTVDSLQTELNETVGTGKTEVTEENGKLKVKFVETGRIYEAGDVYTGEADSGLNWDEILADANKDPEKYKFSPDQVSEYIGIGTDGKAVNMDLWNPTYNSDTDSFSLGIKNDSYYSQAKTYIGSVVDGKIEGTVPQYIYSKSVNSFKPLTHMTATFSSLQDLKIAPEIPTTVTGLDFTFIYCFGLIEAPIIPSSVISMVGTFTYCESLKTAPIIPENVKILGKDLGYSNGAGGCFRGCASLTGDLIINANPTDYTFCLIEAAKNTGCSLKLSGKSTMLNQILSTAKLYNNSSYKYDTVNTNVTLK